MTSRKPEEIEAEILPLKWKLEGLELMNTLPNFTMEALG